MKQKKLKLKKSKLRPKIPSVYLNCGYEDECKTKNCIKCPRKETMTLTLTLAEKIIVEDLAVCDLEHMAYEKEKELQLMQNIAYKLMMKIFNEEKDEKK